MDALMTAFKIRVKKTTTCWGQTDDISWKLKPNPSHHETITLNFYPRLASTTANKSNLITTNGENSSISNTKRTFSNKSNCQSKPKSRRKKWHKTFVTTHASTADSISSISSSSVVRLIQLGCALRTCWRYDHCSASADVLSQTLKTLLYLYF